MNTGTVGEEEQGWEVDRNFGGLGGSDAPSPPFNSRY